MIQSCQTILVVLAAATGLLVSEQAALAAPLKSSYNTFHRYRKENVRFPRRRRLFEESTLLRQSEQAHAEEAAHAFDNAFGHTDFTQPIQAREQVFEHDFAGTSTDFSASGEKRAEHAFARDFPRGGVRGSPDPASHDIQVIQTSTYVGSGKQGSNKGGSGKASAKESFKESTKSSTAKSSDAKSSTSKSSAAKSSTAKSSAKTSTSSGDSGDSDNGSDEGKGKDGTKDGGGKEAQKKKTDSEKKKKVPTATPAPSQELSEPPSSLPSMIDDQDQQADGRNGGDDDDDDDDDDGSDNSNETPDDGGNNGQTDSSVPDPVQLRQAAFQYHTTARWNLTDVDEQELLVVTQTMFSDLFEMEYGEAVEFVDVFTYARLAQRIFRFGVKIQFKSADGMPILSDIESTVAQQLQIGEEQNSNYLDHLRNMGSTIFGTTYQVDYIHDQNALDNAVEEANRVGSQKVASNKDDKDDDKYSTLHYILVAIGVFLLIILLLAACCTCIACCRRRRRVRTAPVFMDDYNHNSSDLEKPAYKTATFSPTNRDKSQDYNNSALDPYSVSKLDEELKQAQNQLEEVSLDDDGSDQMSAREGEELFQSSHVQNLSSGQISSDPFSDYQGGSSSFTSNTPILAHLGVAAAQQPRNDDQSTSSSFQTTNSQNISKLQPQVQLEPDTDIQSNDPVSIEQTELALYDVFDVYDEDDEQDFSSIPSVQDRLAQFETNLRQASPKQESNVPQVVDVAGKKQSTSSVANKNDQAAEHSVRSGPQQDPPMVQTPPPAPLPEVVQPHPEPPSPATQQEDSNVPEFMRKFQAMGLTKTDV